MSSAASGELCRFLTWDSEFFGYRIARVVPERLTAPQLADVLAWCEKERIDCLYFLSSLEDDNTIRLAEQTQFHLVDIRVTLSRNAGREKRPPAPQRQDIPIRPHQAQEMNKLKEIASQSFNQSRFYYDGHFSQEHCDALYRVWVENACNDPSGAVLVAHLGEVAGFITCTLHDGRLGQIGLFSVAQGFRGRGVGGSLIEAAIEWFERQGVDTVSVVTQGRNLAAQQVYQRHGFATQAMQAWYHRWFLSELKPE